MPTSYYSHMTRVVELILQEKPQSVLDVGIGYGKFGCLAREYIEAWLHQRYIPSEWKALIHGIEIFDKYVNPMWGAYDRVFLGDAVELTKNPTWGIPQTGYDLVIMMDMLEHVTRADGLALLNQLKAIGKKIIFSYSNCEQSNVCANKNEDHISKWSPEDFSGFTLVADGVLVTS